MGALLTKLRKENMQAMKDKDTVKKGVLSLVISAIALAEKEQGVTLEEVDELKYVQKELKQMKDTLAQTPANRTDLIEETNKKIAILEGYLPAQMSEEEIKKAIEKLLNELGLEPTKKNQGTIMKTMMATYKGQTDGKSISKVLGGLLK